jgi:nitroreductase
MNILNLVKRRVTVRKYKKKRIPIKTIDKIIEAGRWGPSVHGFQPWRFIVITKTSKIREISDILLKKAKELGPGIDKSLFLTANTIANAPVTILVYNQNILKEVVSRFYKLKKKHIKIAELSEIQAISAAIQNMILIADNFGIGSCWNTTPLFCEKEINKLLGNNEQLIAILTVGYPAEQGKRSQRKTINNVVQNIC